MRARWQRVLLLAAVVGVTTGLGVAGFDGLTSNVLLDHVFELPTAVQAVIPGVGLVLAWAALRYLGRGASPATADEYIANFHDRHHRLALRPAPAKVAASVATLGSGGALGFEGPSIYLGSAVGSFFQRRFTRYFSREDAKLLMVAGAAAGVSAIFKAPATGAVFALEVPYQGDVAARSLLPALVASATSYLTYVAFWGTTPILAAHGAPQFDARDLLGALAIGVLAGVGARAFAWLLRYAKELSTRLAAWPRVVLGGGLIAVLVGVGGVLYSDTLIIGPGYRAINWAADTRHAFALVAALFLLRAVASASTIAGGGAGGTFIPLVVQGSLLGRMVSDVAGAHTRSLFPVIGAAAFLGAGYRTPIAAVMFVAESTGRPGFVVPALVATVLAQLVMGRRSVSSYQHPMRLGHLERRLGLPVSSALVADARTCAPNVTVQELVETQFPAARARSMPVVRDTRYLGMARLEHALAVPLAERARTTAEQVMRTDLPIAGVDWTLGMALSAMEGADVDRIAVTEHDRFLGVVTTSEIIRLDEILDQTERQD